jgi:multidrug efflux pump subunit AcrA (membrane-fusion protein)
VLGALAVLVVVAGVIAAVVLRGATGAEVTAEAATRGDLSVTVSASGVVEAERKIDLFPPTAGTLASIEVTEGQRVTAGTVIATLDAAPIEVQLAQADAAYAGALAQREAAAKAVPGANDKAAAKAAVDAAYAAYRIADARYQAAKAGLGKPSPSDIANAQANVAAAQAAYDAAQAAYASFYENVYLPAPQPRDPALETALAALALARDQAAANLAAAQQTLAALLAAQDNAAAIAAAEAARDQAYAAYLGAKVQQDALAKAASVTAALEAADASADAAAKARALAERTLEKAEIVAPIDGVVIFNGSPAVSLVPGAGSSGAGKPVVGASVSPAAAPFSIVDFDELRFTAQVDEADIARVRAGMTAVVSLDGAPGEEFPTTVASIEPQAVLTSTGGTAFAVRMPLRGVGDRVLLGMNGSADIEVETVRAVITVPVEALLEDGDKNYVYRVVDGKAVYTEIEIGRLTDTRAEVRSGLEEGELVITSGVAGLADGARVRVR